LRLRKIKELHLGVAMKITMRDSSPVLDIMWEYVWREDGQISTFESAATGPIIQLWPHNITLH
jgi:hypothetical protein